MSYRGSVPYSWHTPLPHPWTPPSSTAMIAARSASSELLLTILTRTAQDGERASGAATRHLAKSRKKMENSEAFLLSKFLSTFSPNFYIVTTQTHISTRHQKRRGACRGQQEQRRSRRKKPSSRQARALRSHIYFLRWFTAWGGPAASTIYSGQRRCSGRARTPLVDPLAGSGA